MVTAIGLFMCHLVLLTIVNISRQKYIVNTTNTGFYSLAGVATTL